MKQQILRFAQDDNVDLKSPVGATSPSSSTARTPQKYRGPADAARRSECPLPPESAGTQTHALAPVSGRATPPQDSTKSPASDATPPARNHESGARSPPSTPSSATPESPRPRPAGAPTS